MTVSELEEIKAIIKRAETKAAKAEGVIEKIKAEWKSDYGFDTVEEAKKELEKTTGLIKIQQERQETFMKELENITDWDKFEKGLV